MKKILVVAAHPDDESLGCGATIAKLIKDGNEVRTLILGEGKSSRDNYNPDDITSLKEEAKAANKCIGVTNVILCDLPDNKFDSLPILDIVKLIEPIIKEYQPEIIFTHHRNDLNIDHRITHNAVLTATRPLPNQSVKEIYSFEIISSTEWNYPNEFKPNVFYDVSKTLQLKINAIQEYKSELLLAPHPRSIENIETVAKAWGMKNGVVYSEAFELVRKLDSAPTPQENKFINARVDGDNIYLETLSEDHLETLLQWRNNPDNQLAYREYRVLTMEDQYRWFKQIMSDNTSCHFVIKPYELDEIIGTVSLTHIHPAYNSAEFGIIIADNNFRGSGYGLDSLQTIIKYGFEELNLNRIWCEVFQNNQAINLYTKLGFKQEGVIRQSVYKNNQYLDSYILSMLRDEYISNK